MHIAAEDAVALEVEAVAQRDGAGEIAVAATQVIEMVNDAILNTEAQRPEVATVRLSNSAV